MLRVSNNTSASLTHSLPPPPPAGAVYTSHWCEENIFLLCQEFLTDQAIQTLWDIFVLFISNDNKTVALWNQKAAREDGYAVLWDYHVILVLKPRQPNLSSSKSWVYDYDTRLPMPCLWEEYIYGTFSMSVEPEYQSLFRVVPGEVYLQYFASDRSHMVVRMEGDTPVYHTLAPTYEPLCGPKAAEIGIRNNLMDWYVDMGRGRGRGEENGEVYNLVGVWQYIGVTG